MVDALTSLAFSIHSGKGVYALLLGSGLSRAAQIPTGWEVTLDLIRKVSAIEGESCEPDPAAWYTTRTGREPDYSDLLESIAKTPAERTNALRRYFEASEEDLEEGRKVATKAHTCIARLVKAGYFRVIITTNFDRLLEQALIGVGVEPTVISSADMALGAPPLVHTVCTVIKVHGDYHDTRLKNTAQELAVYPAEMNALLDRIFDEYGLIVCGWSGSWDGALREAMFRSTNRRYTVAWALKGVPSPEAERLIAFRKVTTIPIESADDFFESLEEKLTALRDLDAPHPLSAAMAIASLKRYIAEDRFRIQLHDLVFEETEKQIAELSKLGLSSQNCDDYIHRLELYESSMQILLALVTHGTRWSAPGQYWIWPQVLVRLLDLATAPLSNSAFTMLQRYPALLTLYAGGLAILVAQNYELFRIFVRAPRVSPKVFEGITTEDLVIRKMLVPYVLHPDPLNRCLSERKLVPGSERLFSTLREVIRPLEPNDERYAELFDRLEFLLALIMYDEHFDDGNYIRGAVGRFGWRHRMPYEKDKHVSERLKKEFEGQGENWVLIRAGVFASGERFTRALNGFQEDVLSKFSYIG